MRLVDADEIDKGLKKDLNTFKGIVDLNVSAVLYTAPVAYDIDKVIEALEAEARHVVDNQGNSIGMCIDIDRAVKIVRAGGSSVKEGSK